MWKGSQNYDTNRKPIDRVVIHWIVGNLAAADAVFAKAGGTSAHYAVEDTTIHQYVKEEHVAYHAGNYAMNQRSIGIEHSAAPNRPASEKTYQTAGKILGEICRRHNIPLDRTHVIKHNEVVATQCPGTIDLDKLIAIAKQGGVDMQAELDKLRTERDRNWNLYQETLKVADQLRKERDDNWNKYQEALKNTNNAEAENTLREARDVLNKILK